MGRRNCWDNPEGDEHEFVFRPNYRWTVCAWCTHAGPDWEREEA